jgi:hypothetical protein
MNKVAFTCRLFKLAFWLNKLKKRFIGLLSQKAGLKSLYVNAP